MTKLRSCISVAAVLMALSYETSKSSNNQSLDQGESSISSLTHQIQASTMELVSSSIDYIVAQPLVVMQETIRLQRQGLLDLHDYDELWKYLYFQQTMGFPATFPYFADEDYGGFVSVYPENGPNTPLEVGIIDATATIGLPSRCPQSCTRLNLTKANTMYLLHIKNYGNDTFSLSLDVSFQYSPKQRPWYKLGALQTGMTPVWTPPYVFAHSENDTMPAVGISAAMPVRNDTTQALIGVLGCDISLDMLRLKLEDMKATLTPNAFIFVITDQGVLLASSNSNESTSVSFTDPASQKTDRTVKYIKDLQDPNLLLAAEAINTSCSGNLTKLQPTQLYQSNGLIFQHLFKPVGLASNIGGSINLIIITGAPIADYIGDIEETRKDLRKKLSRSTTVMLITAAAITIAFSLLSIPLTIVLIGWPMNRLNKHMMEVGMFDFSSLRGEDRDIRSWVKQFAGAITDNKSLITGTTYTS
ncbi:hypothetical protein HDU76_005539 [Blyttiomyces sp. JEL0837]|nr:hypothetical protein HDU76_005539 [Blyttiomyces sp. JEL0837]